MNLIRIKAVPSARRALVRELAPDRLEIHTREPAEDNRANRAVIAATAAWLGIPEKRLRIVSGHQKPTKTLRILGD